MSLKTNKIYKKANKDIPRTHQQTKTYIIRTILLSLPKIFKNKIKKWIRKTLAIWEVVIFMTSRTSHRLKNHSNIKMVKEHWMVY